MGYIPTVNKDEKRVFFLTTFSTALPSASSVKYEENKTIRNIISTLHCCNLIIYYNIHFQSDIPILLIT